MRSLILVAAGLVVSAAAWALAQAPTTPSSDANLPAPGSRGNADNVPNIGKRDPNGNPVRLPKPLATSRTMWKRGAGLFAA